MRKRLSSAGGRSPNPPASFYYKPPTQATLVTHKKLDEMAGEEAISYTEQLIARLRNKQSRDQRYLSYRAGQNRHTSTDDLLEQDQTLYAEILAILEEILSGAKEGRYYAGN